MKRLRDHLPAVLSFIGWVAATGACGAFAFTFGVLLTWGHWQ